MKKYFLPLLLALLAASLPAQNLRVLSSATIGRGFRPQISQDGQTVYYLQPGEEYAESSGDLYVSNADCRLTLYRSGAATVLTPDGADAHYIWASLSPDATMILYNTQHGTSVCDLSGRKLYSLGHLNAPQWYGNEHVVGMLDLADDTETTSSHIYLVSLDGQRTQLTPDSEIALYPSASAASGRIVYNTLDGDIRLLQTSLTDNPVQTALPRVMAAPAVARKAPVRKAKKAGFSDLKIYINPGHGGHGSNDRGLTIYPFKSGDVNGFWESNSNLAKGLMLDSMLSALGVQTMMSRRTNNDGGGNDVDVLGAWLKNGTITQAQYNDMLVNGDDRALSAIVAEANAYGADFMISIHSNAGAPSNYILQLYSGQELDDPTVYAHTNRQQAESRAVTTVMGPYLYENAVSSWTRVPYIVGDKTFARKIMGWSNGYGVLRNLQVAGTISEGSMHDYRPETYRLMNMDYKHAEAFHFMQTFLDYYLSYTYPTGAIGGQVRDAYRPMTFPEISYHKNTPDAMKPINGATVKLYQNNTLLQTYTTDTLYNGCYFFWDLTPGVYKVRVEADGYYPVEYNDTVEAGHIAYHNAFINMQRNTPLQVTSWSPVTASITDSVPVSSTVALHFNWDCLADSTIAAFSITPAVEGTLSFENDNRTLLFTPSGRFEPGVEYTVTLSTTACHPDTVFANHLAQPFVLTFRTQNRGSIRYLQSYPAQEETDVPVNPSFVFLFDQKLVNATARTAFSLKDAQGNAVTINTRSFNYNAAPEPYGYAAFELTSALQPSSTYTLTVAGSLTDNIGVMLNDPLTLSFTTAAAFSPTIPQVDPLDTLVFTYDAAQSFGISSGSTLRNTNKKYSGMASNELHYVFSDASAEAFFAPKNPQLLVAHHGDKVGMYVFSDYSGNALYLKFETAGDIHYIHLCDLDYGGWKWQEVSLDDLGEGADFQLMAVRVVRGSSVLSSKGSVYLNRLSFEVAPTALEATDAVLTPEKEVSDGHVFILRNGHRYTAAGQMVE